MQTLKVKLLKNGPTNVTKFVLGQTGCGKSTLMANLLQEEKRFVVFDTRNEYYPEFFNPPALAVASNSQLVEALNKGTPRIIYKFSTVEWESEINHSLYLVYSFQKLNNTKLPPLTISIDELNHFAETSSWPPALQEIIQRGRDYQIRKIFGAQWFNTLPTWVRDSFSEIYTYRHIEPAGVAKLCDYGFHPDDLRELPAHNVLWLRSGVIEQISLVPETVRKQKD